MVPVENVFQHVQKWRSIRVGEKRSDNWSSVGVIDRFKKADEFAVARVTNMRNDYFHLFLVDKALATHKDALGIGKVVLVRQPTIVWSSDPKADGAVLVNRAKNLFIIGESNDLVQCAGYVKSDKQCEAMVDK